MPTGSQKSTIYQIIKNHHSKTTEITICELTVLSYKISFINSMQVNTILTF